MSEIIRKRKSIRKFDLTPLDFHALEKIKAQLTLLKPLYPDIRCSINIASSTKGLFNIKAPHYLIFSSEEREGHPENIGFIGQQMDLYLSQSGLGSCWLGASKPSEKQSSALPHVICIGFGKPGEPLHRELSEFKRKPLSEVSEGDDRRLEAARLAPSGMNAQNWFFIAKDGKIHCYRKKLNPLKALVLDKLSCIDMGIAICHIAQESDDFHFEKEAGAPQRNGLIYMGTCK